MTQKDYLIEWVKVQFVPLIDHTASKMCLLWFCLCEGVLKYYIIWTGWLNFMHLQLYTGM